jgi:phosphatidylinositol glycan class N
MLANQFILVMYPIFIVSVLSSVYPIIFKSKHRTPTSRIISLFLGFGVGYIILSVSVEALFYAAFTCNLLLWIEVEATVRLNEAGADSSKQGCELRTDDIRIALFFLFFVQVAYFGTGK